MCDTADIVEKSTKREFAASPKVTQGRPDARSHKCKETLDATDRIKAAVYTVEDERKVQKQQDTRYSRHGRVDLSW